MSLKERLRHISRGRVVLAVLVVFLLVVIVRALSKGSATAPRPEDVKEAERTLPPPPNEFRQPLPNGDQRTRYVAGNGRVEPAQRENRISAETPGVITRIFVQEGQKVVRGAPLVELDASTQRAAFEAAQADLAAEQATLQRVLRGDRPEDRAASMAEAEAAKAKAARARDTLARTEKLAKTGAATPQELEQARRDAESARADADAAASKAKASRVGSRPEDISVQRAKVLAAQARLEEAKAQLALRTVSAPIDGVVLLINARLGEFFNPATSSPLLIMGDTHKLRVRMEVDERDVGRVRLGDRAFVTADAFGEKRFPGTVVDVGRRVDQKKINTDRPTERVDMEVMEIVIDLDEPGPLLPGLRVTAYVEPNGKRT